MWVAAAPAFTGAHRAALVDRALSEIEARDNAASLLNRAELVLAMTDRQLVRARRVMGEKLDGHMRVKALAAWPAPAHPDVASRRLTIRWRRPERWRTARTGSAPTGRSPRTSSRTRSRRRWPPERIGGPSEIKQLPALLPHLSAPSRKRLVELLVRHVRATASFEIVTALARDLESPALDGLLDLADGLGPREQAFLLTRLASLVSEPQREPTAQRARAAIDRLEPRSRFDQLLQLADADAAEQELIDAAPALGPDELATCVAKLAPHLPPARREHWIGRALARAADGRTVLELLAPIWAWTTRGRTSSA